MPDFLNKLITDAEKRITAGYYNIPQTKSKQPISLAGRIKKTTHNAIIAEIKPISPARGPLRPTLDPVETALQLQKGGAMALSVLTEPDNFGGSLTNLSRIRDHVELPLLMKDIIIDHKQIEAARDAGADCVLLIQAILSRTDQNQAELIKAAHSLDLEVLLEVHDEEELKQAADSDADIIGINNRNLTNLQVDLNTTNRLLEKIGKIDKMIITESGFENAEDIRKLKQSNVDGFLIGSSIMLAGNIESKVREFVLA